MFKNFKNRTYIHTREDKSKSQSLVSQEKMDVDGAVIDVAGGAGGDIAVDAGDAVADVAVDGGAGGNVAVAVDGGAGEDVAIPWNIPSLLPPLPERQARQEIPRISFRQYAGCTLQQCHEINVTTWLVEIREYHAGLNNGQNLEDEELIRLYYNQCCDRVLSSCGV